MLTKEQLLQTINDLPDKFTLDDVLDRVILLDKIEQGLEQSKAGQTKSTEEAREKLNKWLK
jgi:predicted transcriptional regulator